MYVFVNLFFKQSISLEILDKKKMCV